MLLSTVWISPRHLTVSGTPPSSINMQTSIFLITSIIGSSRFSIIAHIAHSLASSCQTYFQSMPVLSRAPPLVQSHTWSLPLISNPSAVPVLLSSMLTIHTSLSRLPVTLLVCLKSRILKLGLIEAISNLTGKKSCEIVFIRPKSNRHTEIPPPAVQGFARVQHITALGVTLLYLSMAKHIDTVMSSCARTRTLWATNTSWVAR